jgi:carbamoyltransferase
VNIICLNIGHNATVGLSIDGSLVSLVHEERITRKKNYTGFPAVALRFVMAKYLNNNLNNIDKIFLIDKTGNALNFLFTQSFKNTLEIAGHFDYAYKIKNNILRLYNFYIFFKKFRLVFILNILVKFKNNIKQLFNSRDYRKKKLVKNISKIYSEIYSEINIDWNKVFFLDHHECHALSALYFLEDLDKEYLMFTMDGEGDGLSSAVYSFKNRITNISSNSKFDSVGFVYYFTTEYLGLKPNSHEFKVMGMSPYANKKDVERICNKIKKIISLDIKGNIKSTVAGVLLRYELKNVFDYERFDNICGASQKFVEDITLEWVEFWVKKTGIKDVILGGGVFMNIKACHNILKSSYIKSLYVVPSSSDDTLPIGALWKANNESNIKTSVIKNLYLGRSFEKELDSFLDDKKINDYYKIIKFNNYNDLNKRVSELLSNNEIIARCCGREEFGARALGNRSIISNPSNFDNISKINNTIKSRDFWMPFSPTILDTDVDLYFYNLKDFNSKYMTCSFDSKDLAKKHLAAAIHPLDKTLRPQTIAKDDNPSYYDLILQFKDKTGVGAVLNTSFNLHGEPNVSSYEDAIHTVNNSQLRYLILENYLLEKK